MKSQTWIGIIILVLVVLGGWALVTHYHTNTPGGPSVSATPQPGPTTITEADSGASFIYPITTRFTVELNASKYPQANLTCTPKGIIGSVSNTPSVSAPLYAASFEAVTPGNCLLQDGDFKIDITVTGQTNSLTTPQGITLSYLDGLYALATTPEQVLVKSYIPPCDQPFNYCLYRVGSDYQGTNFESAGLRVSARKDLKTESSCLNTPPAGYDSSVTPDFSQSATNYSISLFKNMGGGAAGHLASGTLYRLFNKSNKTCTEFETRVGESEYANYPAGTITQFTDQDMANVEAELHAIMSSVEVASSTVNIP